MSESLTATQWGLFELSLDGPSADNPFRDVELGATFECSGRSVEVSGFYDGAGIYRIRFMPDAQGLWTFRTRSNMDMLDGRTGRVEVGPAKDRQHGPVRVSNRFHFRYADGSRYINIGTTAYVWNLQGDALEEQTLATLKNGPFTKVRMCVFPKHYRYNENEPERYPFPVIARGRSAWDGTFRAADTYGWTFDFERFEPDYFRHLERRINQLAEIGIEADLIIFHPYDRWGFSKMTPQQDDRYLKYLVARLSAFPNVWWSMANEYDLMLDKSLADWDRLINLTADSDPYGHLLSIHNCFAFYDQTHRHITHCSIQRSKTRSAALWREAYGKPVSIDECCYEGSIGELWGNITGEKMVHRFWNGVVNGGYVTHGETFDNPANTIWWAKGGKLIGESVARIAFLREILEDGPEDGLEPVTSTGAYRITLAGGLDDVTLQHFLAPAPGEEGWPRVNTPWPTAGQPHEYYLTYFGENRPSEFTAAVPPNEDYDAFLIDAWQMTKTPIGRGVSRGQVLKIAPRPMQAVLLRRSH